MNKKLLVVGLISFIAGAGGGYFITRTVVEKKMREEMDEEIQSQVEAYREYLLSENGLSTTDQIMDEEDIPANVVYTKEESAHIHQAAMELEEEEMVINDDYNPSERAAVIRQEKEEYLDRLQHKPVEITEESYTTDFLDYEKEDIYYFDGDFRFADDDDAEIIFDEDDMITVNSDLFNGDSIIYVRSPGLETDFAIVKVQGTFDQMVTEKHYG